MRENTHLSLNLSRDGELACAELCRTAWGKRQQKGDEIMKDGNTILFFHQYYFAFIKKMTARCC